MSIEQERPVYVVEIEDVLSDDVYTSLYKELNRRVPGAEFIFLGGGTKIKCLRGPSQIKRIPKATRDELFKALKGGCCA